MTDVSGLTNDVPTRASGAHAGTSAVEAAASERGIRRWNKTWVWARKILRAGRRPERTLRVVESLPLGERRFVAVIAFERSRFLVGGTSASLALLARLDNGGLDNGREDATGRAPRVNGGPCESFEKDDATRDLAEVRR